MSGSVQHLSVDGPAVISVADAIAMAARIVRVIKADDRVRLDLGRVTRMSPSVANALVMTILEAIDGIRLDDRVTLDGAAPHVRQAWDKAADRYRRGIRLSTQRPKTA